MDDRGYTLAEMLAALMIVSLVLGAVAGGVAAASKLQHQAAQRAKAAERSAALANGFTRLMQSQGPFSSAGGAKLVGDRDKLSFDCAEGHTCGAQVERKGGTIVVRLSGPGRTQTIVWPGQAAPKFEYIGSKSSGDHWPPDNPTDWQRLRAVAVRRPDGIPLATVRIWIEAPSEGVAGVGDGGAPDGPSGQAGGGT